MCNHNSRTPGPICLKFKKKELGINHGSVHCAWFENSKMSDVNHLKLIKNYLNSSLNNIYISLEKRNYNSSKRIFKT